MQQVPTVHTAWRYTDVLTPTKKKEEEEEEREEEDKNKSQGEKYLQL